MDLSTVVASAVSAIAVGFVTAIVTARLARTAEREKWQRQHDAEEQRWRRDRDEERARRQAEMAVTRATARAQNAPEAEALTVSSAIAYFVITRPNEPRERVFIAPGDRIYAGRDAVFAGIRLPLGSKRHFLLEATETRVIVTDVNSTNGTFVNGVSIRDAPRELLEEDRISVGGDSITEFVFRRLA